MKSIRRGEVVAGYLFILPALLVITIFWIVPSIGSIFYGFFKYDGVNPLKFACGTDLIKLEKRTM